MQIQDLKSEEARSAVREIQEGLNRTDAEDRAKLRKMCSVDNDIELDVLRMFIEKAAEKQQIPPEVVDDIRSILGVRGEVGPRLFNCRPFILRLFVCLLCGYLMLGEVVGASFEQWIQQKATVNDALAALADPTLKFNQN